MGCCGQKRAQLASRVAAVPSRRPVVSIDPPTGINAPSPEPGSKARSVAASTGATGSIATIALRYLANSPVRLHGAVTARAYEFSADRPVLAVAAPDAPVLLASRLFRRA